MTDTVSEFEIVYVDKVKSTVDYAQDYVEKQNSFRNFVIYTNNQTNGRGYGKNKWESEPGKNLTVSYVIFPEFQHPENQFQISKMISLAIIDFCNLFIDDVKIKWPNDIYCGNKKVAGILIENAIQGGKILHSVNGTGININQMIFVKKAPNPVSLKQITGIDYKLDECFKILTTFVQTRYLELMNKPEKTDDDYLRSLYKYKIFSPYKYSEGYFNGKITGIDPYGKLIIETERGESKLFGIKELEFIL